MRGSRSRPGAHFYQTMKAHLFLPAALLLAILPCSAKTKVACVGDSITFGFRIPQRETNTYPYYLQQMLGDDFEVKNFGNSGKTAGDYPGQVGRFYGSTQEHRNAVDFAGDIYICNLGINDTGAWWNAKLFVEGYNKLIDQWRAGRNNLPVFMWTKLAPDFRGKVGEKTFPGNVFPGYSFPQRDNGSAAKRPEAEKLLEQIAAKHRAVAINAYAPMKDHPEQMVNDGLHPNAAGAKRIAQFTCSALFREKPWKQQPPRIETDRNNRTVTLSNAGKQALVLDAGILVSQKGERKICLFRFGTGSVLAPGETATIRFKADKNANDFAAEMTTKADAAGSVRYIPAPVKGGKRKEWESEAAWWATPGK